MGAINAAFAFFIELAMLVAYAYGGYTLTNHSVLRWVVAFLVVAAVIAVWAFFLAPKAELRLDMPWLVLVKLALFAGAVLVLAAAHHVQWAVIFFATALINTILAVIWKQS